MDRSHHRGFLGPTCIAGCLGRRRGRGATPPVGQPRIAKGSRLQTLWLEGLRDAHPKRSPLMVWNPPSSPHFSNAPVVTAQCPSLPHSTPLPFPFKGLRFFAGRTMVPGPFCRPPIPTWGRCCSLSDLPVVGPSRRHLQRAQVSNTY